MKKIFAHLLVVAALVLPGLTLSGCESPPAESFPNLTYSYLPPIKLAVGSFNIVSRYVPPLKPPHVDYLAPVPPYKAARQWALDRIQTTGGRDSARFVIRDASIVETKLPIKGGIEGTFTRQQAKKYDGHIAVMLEILDPTGHQVAYASAEARRSETAPEGATIDAREKIWFKMTDKMMHDLNAQLEKNIKQYLGRYLEQR